MTTEHSPLWRRLAQAFAGTQAVSQGKAMVHAAAARPALSSSMRPLALEQRFMFDGAGASDAAHAVAEAAHPVARIAAMVATSMNEAPTLTVNLKVPQILEDATNINGVSIVSLVDSASPDPDASASLAGLVVVGNSANSATEGTWQYSSNGTDWYSIGTVSNNAGLVLSSATLLRFEPVADYNGAISALTVRALGNTYSGPFSVGEATQTRATLDAGANGGSTPISAETRTISGSIIAVNDAPSFTKGNNVTVLEDAGSQTLVGWASDISAGPANESGQTLTWVVSNNNIALFSVQPSVDSNGTLRFTPGANANGVATVSVTLKDSGGTANGGVDTSTTQTFTITVTPVNDAPTGEVTLGGSSTEGQTLTVDLSKLADVDGIVGGTFSFQWQQLDGGIWKDIAGANAATMSLGSDQVGKQVRVKVSYVDNGDTLETVFSTASGTVAGVIPTATAIERASDQIVESTATSIVYTVTFNVAVTGVDISDFMLNPTGTASGSVASVSGSGKSWQVTVNNLMGDGTLRLDLKSSGTGIQGAGGNTPIAGGYISGQTFTLDHTAPATPAAPTLAAASDSGSSSSDGITNVTMPTLTGTAEAGSTVHIYDQGILIGSAVATGGSWSFIPGADLLDGPHNFTVAATDAAGNVSALSAALQVTIDTSVPTVASVGVPAASTYHIGETLTFTVNFNEAVFVDTGGGTPRIAMVIGSTTRYATYVSGSGSDMLQFSYTVASGDADTDGISVGALSANGGTLRDAAGNNATLTLNSMGSTANVLVDGIQASVTSVSASTLNGSYGPGSTITVTVDFSRAVAVDTSGGAPTLTLSSGGTATYSGGSGSSTLTFTYTVGAGQNSADLDYASINALALNGAVITDAVDGRNASLALAAPGSAGSLGANKNIVIDTVAPTTTGSTVLFSADTGNSSTDLITNTAVQTISGTLTGNLASGETVEVSLDNGVTWATALATSGSLNWSLAGQTLIGSNTLQVRVVDAAGNSGSVYSQAYVLDQVAPSATITSDLSTLQSADWATLTIKFSEAPSGFTLGDLVAINGTLSNLTATADPLVYTVIFRPTAGIANASASVLLTAASYTDTAGNDGTGASSAPMTINTIGPGVRIDSDVRALKAGESTNLTITFSTPPVGFALNDLTVSHGTLSGLAATANPLVYTAVLTPAANWEGLVSVSVASGAYTDAMGNLGTGTTSPAIAVDTRAPTVTITSSAAALKAGESATLTFTFSEAPNGFTVGDLNATNGALSNFTATSNPLVYTVVFTPNAGLQGSSGAVSLAAGSYTDTAGNAGGAGVSAPIAIDTLAPAVVITSSASSLKAGETALITFTFSEAPQGFNLGDVAVSGGILSGFAVTANPLVYTALFTPTANVNLGQATVSISAGSYTDAAGNAGQAASTPNIEYHTVVPTTTVGSVQFSSDSGASASDLITNVSEQTISGTLTANLLAGERVQVSLDNGATWVAATGAGSAWTLSGQTLLGSGILQVRVVNSDGNTGAVYAAAYTLDQSSPTVTISSDVTTVNAVTPARITFTFSETPVGFDAGAISVTGGTLGVLTATSDPKVFTATFTPNSGIANGSAVISVSGGAYTDVAGNAGTAGMLSSLLIDTVAPTAMPGGIHFSHDSGVQGDFITNVGTQTISGSLSVPLAQGDQVLISLDGGANWTSASVSGSSWSASASLLPGSNTLQVKVSDAAGNEGAVLSQAYVLDTTAPNVDHVDLPADGVYGVGQKLDFTVHFSEAVMVDASGGAPRIAITLDTGGTVYADYVSGSGGSALVFRLTVASGQLDTDGIRVADNVQLNGGSIRDVAGNDSTTGFIAPSTNGILVDGVAPTVADVIVPVSGSYKAGDVLSFTANASEAVFTSGSPRLAVDIGGTTRYATFVPGSSVGTTLVFQYTVQADDNDADGISVASSLDLNGGSVKDAAGNDLALTLNSVGSTAEVLVDTVVPSVTSIVRAGGSPSNSGSVSYTVTFSEDVSGVDISDFTATFGGTSSGSLASVTQIDGHTYTVVIDNLAGAGNVTLSLNGSGTGIRDAANNLVSAGLTGEAYAVDRVAPAVTSVSVPSNAIYVAGQILDFTVNLDEATLVDTSNGTPRILVTLDNGQTAWANYVSGTGTTALVFRLIVANGQFDSDGIAVGSTIQLNGATLRDAVGNDANLNLNNVGDTSGVKVDAVVPQVSSVDLPANGSYKAGDVLNFTINTSEGVVVDTLGGTPRLVLTVGGVTRYANYVFGAAGGALVFQYTVQSGDTASGGIAVNGTLDLNGGHINDPAGNALNLNLGAVGSTGNVLVDTTTPYATNITRVDATPNHSSSVSYTVTFSENVGNVDASDFNLIFGGSAAGSIESITAVDGRTFTVKVSGLTGTGTVRLDLRPGTDIADAAGNQVPGGYVGESYSIDRDVPSVTRVDVPANGIYVAGQNLDFTVYLSERVQLDASNGSPRLEVLLDSGQMAWAEYLSGAGTNALMFRMVVATGQLDTNGISVGNAILLNGGTLRDAAGNDASTTLNNVGDTSGVKVDAVIPVVDSVDLPASGSYKAGDVLTFTVNTSETVFTNGLPRLAVDIGGVTRYATFVPGSSVGTTLVFQYTVQAGDNDADGISVASSLDLNGGSVKDAAGNDLNLTLNSVGSTAAVQVDTTAPQILSMSLDKAWLNARDTAQLTIRFSEAVKGLDVADFTVTDGALSNLVSTDGGLTWTATLTPALGKVQAQLQIALNNAGYTDLAGNAGSNASVSSIYAIDTVLPPPPELSVEHNAAGWATVRVGALEAHGRWEYSLDGGQTWLAGQGNRVQLFNLGEHVLQVRQMSGGGNLSMVAVLQLNVVLELIPPIAAWISAPISERDAAAGAGMLPPPLVVPGMPGVLDSLVRGLDAFGPMVAGGGLTPAPFIEGNDRDSKISALASILGGGLPAAPLGVLPYEDVGIGAFGFSARDAWAPAPAESGLVQLTLAPVLEVDSSRQLDWQVPATLFGHSDPLAQVQLSLTLADGRPLPTWLQFDARTGQVKGTVPAGLQGDLALRLTARDGQGREVNTTIQLKLGASGPAARAGMAEQLQRAAQQRAGQLAAQRL